MSHTRESKTSWSCIWALECPFRQAGLAKASSTFTHVLLHLVSELVLPCYGYRSKEGVGWIKCTLVSYYEKIGWFYQIPIWLSYSTSLPSHLILAGIYITTGFSHASNWFFDFVTSGLAFLVSFKLHIFHYEQT